MAEPPLLSLRDLVVEFPTRRGVLRAVNGVSLDVAAGEVLGLVGESGAGKSVTGAAIIGLLEPPGRIAGGEVWFKGERIDRWPERALRKVRGRHVAMIFQDPLTALNPLYTIGDQLIETIRAHCDLSVGAARQQAVELLSAVGIPAAGQRLNAYPHEFSGGMRQRVVIALALAAGPELVIADEPTTSLDVSVQAQIIDLLRRLCRQKGTAIVLITHDIGVIAETADRVAVMYAGRIVEVGAVRDILDAPRHPYTCGLISSIPSLQARRERLAQIPGVMPRLDAIPPGCAFHPRCGHSMEICRRERPPRRAVGGHEFECFLEGQPEAAAPAAHGA